MRRSRVARGFATVVGLVLTMAPGAMAKFPTELLSCRKGIALSSRILVQRDLKTIQQCNNSALQSPGSCLPPGPPTTLTKLELTFRDRLAKSCATTPDAFLADGYLNYPGPCSDPTPGDMFTIADLQSCLLASHEAAVNSLIGIEYHASAPVDAPTLQCQLALAKNAGKFTLAKLKTIQTCLNKVPFGTSGQTCRTDPIVTAKIAKADSKARADITGRCSPSSVAALGLCSDPTCAAICGTCDATCAAECIIVSHGDAVSNLDADVDDLIDFESPMQSSAPRCGDGTRNRFDEECDGSDDANCAAQCGAVGSPFACLCLDKRRERVIEHADTDLDTGWTGLAHDSAIVEGGGYVVDLYDCDGPNGLNTLCTVGPSCSGSPHPPCSNDSQCASLGLGTCRKEGTAVGPHCKFDPKTSCTCDTSQTMAQATCIDLTHCPTAGNFCIQRFHTPPLPLSAGGIPVCVVNVFTEDIVGTKDLATGASAIRLRQSSIVQVTGTQSQPCPVCGGFCKAAPGNLGGRHNCTSNADCADTTNQTCVTAHICSFGPNQGQTCRPDPPYGGPTPLFGTPSIDCPPTLSSPGILDILFDPQSTEAVSMQPSIQCNQQGFGGKTCIGGVNEGATCTSASACPGGTCNDQCFCPAVGGAREQPNACDAACVGGSHDTEPCAVDSECTGGFCHDADCRVDPTALAAFQPHEGGCTTSVEGRCSHSSYQGCLSDADCKQPNCALCQANETCNVVPKNCFINSRITRSGVASTTNPVLSAIFCIAATGQSVVDSTAGLPGPGAIRQTSTVIDTGF